MMGSNYKLVRVIIILSFQFLIFSSIYAQINTKRFRHLTVQDGLTRNWVKCILQDNIGYLWIGSADGLNRYDGISVKTYNYKSDDKHSIDNNDIFLIYEDKRSNLWIGTQAGLNLYDRQKDRFIRIPFAIKYVRAIYEYPNGLFLIGSPAGLYLFDPVKYTGSQIRYDLNIEDILHDSKNNFWLATYHGLILLDTTDYSGKTIFPEEKLGNSANTLIRVLFEDSKGGIWAGTDSDGLINITYSAGNSQSPHIVNIKSDIRNRESINNGAIYAITEDEKGYLWIGIENGGVNLLNLNTFSGNKASFTHYVYNKFDPDGLSDNSIHSIYRDKQNTMWIGTYANGLNYYNDLLQKFAHFKLIPGSENSINNNSVNAVFEEDNFLWIGTEGGLNLYDKRKKAFRYFIHDNKDPKSIGSNAVWSIFRDSLGNLWIGTWSGGLNLFNEQLGTFTRFMHNENNPNSIGGNNIVGIIETADNYLWISSMLGGLNCYDYNKDSFLRYKVDYNKNSISGDWVMSTLNSSDSNLWILTTVGVDYLNRKSGHFTAFTHNPVDNKSISYNAAIVIYEDSKQNIWIGTNNGLNLYNKIDSTFKHYFQVDGLPSNIIRAIEEDNKGNIWLSTNNGISKFVNAVNLTVKPVFINYNLSDGLQGYEFNSRSSFKNKDGLIYFGGNNGYNVIDPANIKTNPYIPNVVFTSFLLFNKPVNVGDKDSLLTNDISMTADIRLSHKDNVFTIEFASLNLLAPENNQYAFIMQGFENQWNYMGKQHSATYTNLDPGKYTFKVKASNNDGLWNDEGISLNIVIVPAWWQSLAAKLFYLLLLSVTVYFFQKHTIISVNLKNELWREHLEKKKTEELSQLKNQFFTNVSHELRTPLTLIIGPIKKLMSETQNIPVLQTIYRNASRLKTLVEQIMDISKIESQMMKLNMEQGDIVNYILNCTVSFIEFARQKDITLHYKSTVAVLYCSFDPDKIEKIVSNILSNALKNTYEKGTVIVSLGFEKKPGTLVIEITDNGRGMEPLELENIFDRFFSSSKQSDDFPGIGIGLDLTKKLVELHNGTITVSSIPGKGSTFKVTLPLTNSKIEFGAVEKIMVIPETTSILKGDDRLPQEFKHEKRILVIDDNVEMCDFIESILSGQYDVIKEPDSSEALTHVLNFMPDLIISDVMMPGINGFEIVRKVRNDLRFSHIPIILLTAKVAVNDHITGYDTGADDYIYKPFDGELLKARIKNLIAQKENLRRHFIGTDGIINSTIQANNLDIEFIDNILNLVKTHYSKPEFNVNDIIEKVGISRSLFYKKFKALSDQSINDLIRNVRIKKAAELLKTNQLSISQVAYECGFSDPAYFSRVFKEFYKMSPIDYIGKR